MYITRKQTLTLRKKKSNHRESTKRGVIKGYADRARSYCDPGYLEDELNNIIDIFEDNGYTRKEVKDAMESKERNPMEKEQEKISRGIVIMQNVPGFTQEFNRIARQHGFTVTNKTENRVKDLIANAKTPLGDKNTNVVYSIPCGCRKHGYTGETDRMWETRRKEHKDKVRLTKKDLEAGKADQAKKRMNDGDGGLARHATVCPHDIDWDNAKIVNKEQGWSQRKYLEGIESLRQKNRGITPLNSYNQLEQWQSVIYSFL